MELRTHAVPEARVRRLAGAGAVAFGAVVIGAGVAALGAAIGPWVMVAIPAAALWFAAALARPVWGVVLVFVSLPIALNELPVGGLQIIDVVVVVAIGMVVVTTLVHHHDVHLRIPALGWGVALCALAVLSVPGAIDTSRATTRVISLVAGFLLATAIVAACRSLADLRLLVAAFLVVGIAMTVLALQNLSALRPEAGGLIVRQRPSGVFGDPNELGSFAAMLLLVAVGTLLARTRMSLRLLAAVAAASGAGALIFSLSRGAWLGAGIGFVGLLVLLPGARRTVFAVLAVGALLGIAIGAFRASSPEVAVVRDRLGAITRSVDSPYDNRPQIWAEARREIAARPWFGSGAANFPLASARPGSETRTIGAEHAHNVVLTVAAEAGLAAAGALIGMTIAVGLAVRRAVRGLRGRPDAAIVAGIGAALFGAVGHGLIDNTTNNPVILALLFALTGMVLAAAQIVERRRVAPQAISTGDEVSRVRVGEQPAAAG